MFSTVVLIRNKQTFFVRTFPFELIIRPSKENLVIFRTASLSVCVGQLAIEADQQ